MRLPPKKTPQNDAINTRPWKLSLLLIVCLTVLGCREEVLHDLSETDANRIITELDHASIRASKAVQSDGRWTVEVSKDQAIPALKILEGQRILRNSTDHPLPEPSMVSSREEQRFRFERGLSQEIERTLRTLDGVLDARVHLNLPPVDPLFNRPIGDSEGTASVLMVVQRNFNADKQEIANLLVGAAGIKAEKVAVLISKAQNEGDSRKHALLPAAGNVQQNFLLNHASEISSILGIGLIIGLIVFTRQRKSRAMLEKINAKLEAKVGV
jgi:type III secretion protein J